MLSKLETEKLFEVFITLNGEVMAQGTDHSLRSCLADWTAACCSRFPDLLPSAVNMLLSFVKDAPPAVLRSGIRALAQLLRPALVLICDSDIHSAGAMADLTRLWEGLAAACAAVRGFAAHPDAAARHAAVKFLERCALLFSLADEERGDGGGGGGGGGGAARRMRMVVVVAAAAAGTWSTSRLATPSWTTRASSARARSAACEMDGI